MPSRTVKTSISVDADLMEAAREKSRQFDRFRESNLSGYINWLLRRDLGLDSPGDQQFEQRGGAILPKDPAPDRAASEGLRKAVKNLKKAKE